MKKKLIEILNTMIIFTIVILAFYTISEATNEIQEENQTNTTNSVENNTTHNQVSNTITNKENNTINQNNTTTNIVDNKEESKKENDPVKQQQTTSTTSKKQEKSSNANLKNLGITPNDFKGFKSDKTNYDIEVPKNIEKIEVYAQAQDSKAKIEGTGTYTIKSEGNVIDVKVTAEDGTVKTYTLNIKQEQEKEEKETETVSENIVSSNVKQNFSEGISEIKIENIKRMTPEFETQVYNYTVKYIGDAEKLELNVIPTNLDFKVEIVGNENLKEGNENYITILVSDKNGKNIATYQLNVEKSLIDEEEIAKKRQELIRNIAIISIISLLMIIIIIVIIVKKRKNKYKFEYEEDIEYEEDEENNENIIEEDYNYDFKKIENLARAKVEKELRESSSLQEAKGKRSGKRSGKRYK